MLYLFWVFPWIFNRISKKAKAISHVAWKTGCCTTCWEMRDQWLYHNYTKYPQPQPPTLKSTCLPLQWTLQVLFSFSNGPQSLACTPPPPPSLTLSNVCVCLHAYPCNTMKLWPLQKRHWGPCGASQLKTVLANCWGLIVYQNCSSGRCSHWTLPSAPIQGRTF